MIERPSGDQDGSVSIAGWRVTGRTLPDATSSTKMSGLPSLDSVTASSRPSGDQAGAPLMPGKSATFWRWPLYTSCTKIAGLRFSKET